MREGAVGAQPPRRAEYAEAGVGGVGEVDLRQQCRYTDVDFEVHLMIWVPLPAESCVNLTLEADRDAPDWVVRPGLPLTALKPDHLQSTSMREWN